MAAKNMVNTACCILLSMMLFMSSLSYVLADTPPQTSAATWVLAASKDTIKVGDTLSIVVAVENVQDLFGVQFGLAFDRNLLKLDSVSKDFSNGYSRFESDCIACEPGITPIYSLTRNNAQDVKLKPRIELGTFTFQAVKSGVATIELRQLKGVSTVKFTNEHGREDLEVISIQGASSLKVTVKNSDIDPTPSPTPSTSPSPTPSPGSDTGSDSGSSILDEINDLIASQLTVSASKKVERNGRTYASVDMEGIREAIRTITSLRKAAEEKGLSIPAPRVIHVNMDKSNENALLIPFNFIELLSSAGLDLILTSSGATLVFPISAINDGETKDVVIGIKRMVGPVIEMNGSMYRPAAMYDFEAYWLTSLGEKKISRFTKEVTATIEYDPKGFDPEKIGFYYFNTETDKWEHIKGRHHIGENKYTVTLSHFSRYAVMELTKRYDDLKGVYPEAARAIEVLSAHHILEGQGGNYFTPNQSMTRAEFVKVLAKALDWEIKRYNGGFDDVSGKEWFADYVGTAKDRGVVQGNNSRFHPNDPVTREEMVTMLMRAHPGAKPALTGVYVKFADDESISSWAKEAVYSAKALGFVNGVGANRFAPKNNTVRADMAVLFYKYLKNSES